MINTSSLDLPITALKYILFLFFLVIINRSLQLLIILKVWDLTNFALVIALRDHVGEVNAIALTDKSLNYLISASFDKNIKVRTKKDK